MKLLQICLSLVAHTLVVAMKRRVSFMNCPFAKSNSDLLRAQHAQTITECSLICLNDPQCVSASYCRTNGAYLCQLSGFYTNGSCSGLVADVACSQITIVNPCENGATFFPQNRTCQCVEGYTGAYCQRRYRDCLEAPRGHRVYTIQPFGTDHIFQWRCNGKHSNDTLLTEVHYTLTYDRTLPWEVMRRGIPVHPGYYFTGLENLHQLTKQGVYDLYILMIVYAVDTGFVIYKNFRVDSESEGYACHWDSFERSHSLHHSDVYLDGLGALGDVTKTVNGGRFGTYDNDVNGCASSRKFSWWFNPLGCAMVAFDEHRMFWPTNRNGTIEMEPMDYTRIALFNTYWYAEDDLIL